jgi:hypothetical protein
MNLTYRPFSNKLTCGSSHMKGTSRMSDNFNRAAAVLPPAAASHSLDLIHIRFPK